jgi:hypothetical protein
MALELIERLLADPDPAFACYANGDRTKKESFLAPLAHLVNPPAKASLLRRIPPIPGSQQAKEVFKAYNGLLLYTDRKAESEGIEIFPISEWQERTAQMVESWVEEREYYPDEDMPRTRRLHCFCSLQRSKQLYPLGHARRARRLNLLVGLDHEAWKKDASNGRRFRAVHPIDLREAGALLQ